MLQSALQHDADYRRKTKLVKKSSARRVIAPLPFRAEVSAKVIDAAIKRVMARRSVKVQRELRIATPGDAVVTESKSK